MNLSLNVFQNAGSHILWKHIVDVYQQDEASVLKRTRLTSQHINLTAFNVMSVRNAAQVYIYINAYIEIYMYIHTCKHTDIDTYCHYCAALVQNRVVTLKVGADSKRKGGNQQETG